MMDFQKELENSRRQLADLKTGYQSVLDFIDRMEHHLANSINPSLS